MNKKELTKLKPYLKEPKTLFEIAYHMSWGYSTASQKMGILEAGEVAIRTIVNNRVKYHILQELKKQ